MTLKKIRKLKGMESKLIDLKSYNKREVSPNLFPLQLISLLLGQSGAGKTQLLSNLLCKYQDERIFDKIYIFSPSSTPDEKTGLVADRTLDIIAKRHPWCEIQKFDSFSKGTLLKIIDEMRDKHLDYRNYKSYVQLLAKYYTHPDDLTSEEMDILLEMELEDLKCPNATGRTDSEPTFCVVLDDCTNTARSCRLMDDFCSRVRHLNSSLIQTCQYLKFASPVVRKNSNLVGVWKNKDRKYLKEIYDSFFSSNLSYEDFNEMIDLLQNKWDCIITDTRKPEYRINLDTVVEV